jgi:hypothetical protein
MTKSEPNFADFLRQRAEQYAAAQNDVVVNYLKTVIKPGDKTLQLGACDLAANFVKRGAFHEVAGSDEALADLQRYCDDHDISTERMTVSVSQKEVAPTSLDAVILGANLEFSILAGRWKSVSERLKIGGVLILTGANISSSARLTDALSHDAGWALHEMLNGDVAVFRKTAGSPNEVASSGLVARATSQPAASSTQPGLVAGVLRALFRGFRSSGASSAR